MIEIHKTLHSLQKQLKAPKGQYNNFGKYSYRHYEDIILSLKEIMPTGCSIVLTDKLINCGDRYYVEATATLYNAEGQNLSASALAREQQTKKGMDEAQITGGASSYARKYALNGLFAIDSSEIEHDSQDNSHEPEPKEEVPDYLVEQVVAKVTKLINDNEIEKAKELMNEDRRIKRAVWNSLGEAYQEELKGK